LLQDEIATRCSEQERIYNTANEEMHNAKRDDILEKVQALHLRTAEYREKELSLIERNKSLLEKLQRLKEQVARDQAAKF
jgi:hypothetical protein